MLWLAEDHCVAAQSAASRDAESRLDLYACLRGLQPGAHAKPDAQRNSDVVRPGRGVSERRSNASFGCSVARKITSQVLENSGRTQTNLEIARSARFFSGLLENKPGLWDFAASWLNGLIRKVGWVLYHDACAHATSWNPHLHMAESWSFHRLQLRMR